MPRKLGQSSVNRPQPPPLSRGSGSGAWETVLLQLDFAGAFALAFLPASKSFVYLNWKGDEPRPEPACSIWDHQTEKTIALYQFPNVECPLPVIPSIQEMKVCPKTGDKDFKYRTVIAYD